MTSAADRARTQPRNVVLFGNRAFASLAWHALANDSPHNVVGFTVDRDFVDEPVLHGLPVVAFDEIERHFDPARIAMLMSIGWEGINGLREGKYREAAAKGYSFVSYVASRALVWPDLEIGQSCMIFDGAIVQPFARLGDGVILRSGCHISHHVDIGDFCFVSAHAVIGGSAHLGSRSFIGLNATIRDNIRVGERSVVGAGAAVGRDIESDTTYAAIPAKRVPDPRRSDAVD